MLLAAIDIGTNSLRLFLGRRCGERLVRIRQELRITRLGQGLDASGVLHPKAVHRTLDALGEYKAILDQQTEPYMVKVAATSAVRDAADGAAFLTRIEADFGWDVQRLAGESEARLSYVGALAALPASIRPQQALVLDVGGGSSELFYGKNKTLLGGISLQLGAVRMTERFISGHPIAEHEWQALQDGVGRLLVSVPGRLGRCSRYPLIAVGGTATTLAALQLQLQEYDPDCITGRVLTASSVGTWAAQLAAMDLQARAALPGMNTGREDVLPAGAAIIWQIMTVLAAPSLMVSDGDLLQGMLLQE